MHLLSSQWTQRFFVEVFVEVLLSHLLCVVLWFASHENTHKLSPFESSL